MFLALREMRRAVVRFGLLALAIGLLMFLILFQQALRDGLVTSFVGGLRNLPASLLVYSVDAQRTLQGSVVPPPVESAARATEGVDRVARVRQGTFTARAAGADEIDATVVASDDPGLAAPARLAAGRAAAATGEAVGSDADFAVGDTVTLAGAPGQEPVEIAVVGLAADAQLNVTPTLYTDLETLDAAARALNPAAAAQLPNALAVGARDGVDPAVLAGEIEKAAPDAEVLTPEAAAETSPGVAQVRQSFQVIFLLYGLVVPLLMGLFFLIITVQKARTLTLLRAMGAATTALSKTLLVQVLAVIGVGIAFGVVLYTPLSSARVGGLALRFDAGAVLAWSGLFVVLGLAGAAVAFRRVLAVDPLEATSGGGLQ